MPRILITAIGSFSADIVIKTLKAHGHYVVGSDVYPKSWIADSYNVSQFYQMPYASDKEEYLNCIEKICREERIEYVIPLIDPEVDLLSSQKERLLKQGIHVCLSDEDTIKLCRDKYRLMQFLCEQGFKNIIPTSLLEDAAEVELPAFIKPISGRSSQGCRAIHNHQEFECMKHILPGKEYIIQPLIQGRIITVDVVRNPSTDQVVCILRRELLRNKSGAGITVEMIENPELEAVSAAIAESVGIIGAVNFEFIESDDGKYYFLEINPRFSGGVEFSHIAGYDVVYNHLCCFSNKKIEKKALIKKIIIAKKYEEYITEYMDND